MSPGPLHGVRVLDLTTAWAGPFVGHLIGALGADVVKVESGLRYDLWRGGIVGIQLPRGSDSKIYDVAPGFTSINRNKRGVSLELAHPEGRAAFLKLVTAADMLVTNFTVRVLPNLDLDYPVLAEANPALIFLTMPALGASGPYRGLAGYGSVIEAMGGMAALAGYPEEGARAGQTFLPDPIAGVHATAALLAALLRRRSTGEGAYIDLSQQETTWMQFGEGTVHHSLLGRDPTRLGNSEPGTVPSGFFPGNDERWVAIVVHTDAEFQRLCAATAPHLDQYTSMSCSERRSQRRAIEAALVSWTRTNPASQITEILGEARVRARMVNTFCEAETEPAMLEVDAFEHITHPDAGTYPYSRVPLRYEGRPATTLRRAPRFAEHTDEVLTEWAGMDGKEISRLRAVGAVLDEIDLSVWELLSLKIARREPRPKRRSGGRSGPPI